MKFQYQGFIFQFKDILGERTEGILSFKEQRGYIFRNKSLLFGFGTGLLLVLAIPLFQFLCIPSGVVSGTRICFDAKSPMVVDK